MLNIIYHILYYALCIILFYSIQILLCTIIYCIISNIVALDIRYLILYTVYSSRSNVMFHFQKILHKNNSNWRIAKLIFYLINVNFFESFAWRKSLNPIVVLENLHYQYFNLIFIQVLGFYRINVINNIKHLTNNVHWILTNDMLSMSTVWRNFYIIVSIG